MHPVRMARFREFLVDARVEIHVYMFTRLLVRLFFVIEARTLIYGLVKPPSLSLCRLSPTTRSRDVSVNYLDKGTVAEVQNVRFSMSRSQWRRLQPELSPDSNVEGDTDALTQTNEISAGLREEPARKPKVIPDTQTLLCKYFAQGLCKHGDNCQFRHGGVQFFTNSSSSSPFVATTTRSTENSDEGGWTRRPTVQCKFYAEGNCIRGDDCSFLHGAHSKTLRTRLGIGRRTRTPGSARTIGRTTLMRVSKTKKLMLLARQLAGVMAGVITMMSALRQQKQVVILTGCPRR
ncbi:hypothetical protein IMY05_C4522000700 [Salix suchowensis]|nr:hypothetical protein IMY05_C4522000700 [Salix suchowensis]